MLGLIVALIPVVVFALPKAEGADTDVKHPVIGSADDKFPADPPRDFKDQDIKSAGSVALVFEFGSWYGYQTMGGSIPGTNWNTSCPVNYGKNIPEERKRVMPSGMCRNWDQNQAVANVIAPLKGSPLSVGIYHYARKMDEGVYGNNTPDLRATSLADEAGYQRVMDKIWSLDATNGKGGNLSTAFGGNTEWGLGKLYRDMYLYQQQEKALHQGDPNYKPRPLYSKIIIFSMADPHWHLSKSTQTQWKGCRQLGPISQRTKWNVYHDPEGRFVDDPDNIDSDWLHDCNWAGVPLEMNPGRAGALDVARMIRGMGADIRTFGMGDWVDRFKVTGHKSSSRHYYLRALTGEFPDRGNPLDPSDPSDPYFQKESSENTTSTDTYQYVRFPSDNGGVPSGYFGVNGRYFKDPDWDDLRNGTVERRLGDWVLEDRHLSITSDMVDGDFRFVKPVEKQKLYFTPLDHPDRRQNYYTGVDGRMVLNLTKAEMTKGIEIRQASRTDDSLLTQFQKHNGRCAGFNKGTKKFEEFAPENLEKDGQGRAGFKITAGQIDQYVSIKCSTYSRPLQKMQFVKRAEVANEQIRYEVGGYPGKNNAVSYEFKWECKDPKAENPEAVVTSGTAERKVHGLNVIATLDPININDGKPMPVGTQCIIKETLNLPVGYDLAKANGLFTSNTSLEGKNFEINTKDTEKKKDNEGKQSVSNKIVGNLKLYDSNTSTEKISKLISHTVYSSVRASIKVYVNFTNSQNDPGLAARIKKGTLPKKIPVYYNCRFMPDPTKPPELPEKNQGAYPGFVGVDWVGVPTDGRTSFTLGLDKAGKPTWPVGTHCLFSTVPPNKNIHGPNPNIGAPVNLPGVITSDTYESTVCASDALKKPTNVKKCRNNYFWVHSGGEQTIRLYQDLKRLTGKLQVTKELAGEAYRQGVGASFPFAVECKDGDTVIPIPGHDSNINNRDGKFWVRSTAPTIIDGIPAGTDCKLTEIEGRSQLTNANVKVPDPISISPITDVTEPKPVTITNTATYKQRDLQITHKINWANPVPGTDLQNVLKEKDNVISVACTVPGDAPQPVRYVTIKGEGNATVHNVPQGSVCTLQSSPQGISNLKVNFDSAPQEYTLAWNSSGEAHVNTTYSLPEAGKWYLHTVIKTQPEYQALRALTPETAQAQFPDLYSGKTINHNINLRDGGKTEITSEYGIPSSKEVKFIAPRLPENLINKIDLKYAFVDDEAQALSPEEFAKVAKLTTPDEGQSKIDHLYVWLKMKNTTAHFSTQASIWTSKNAQAVADADKIPVPSSWRNAALGISSNSAKTAKLPVNVECTLGSGQTQSTVTYLSEISNDGSFTSVNIPAGWACKVKVLEDAVKIPGTDLKSVHWNGQQDRQATRENSGGLDEPAEGTSYIHSWVSDSAQYITLKRDYRMQLSSFNLKKKVGGEGVTIISGDKQFEIKWSCKLNGADIAIPAPREIGLKTDAQKSFGDDLRSRLATLESESRTAMGRFEQGEWHVVDALPAGSVCTLTESPKVAQEPNTIWDHYWEITGGYRSREPASACEASSGKCRPADEGKVVKTQVLLPRDVPAKANPYFKASDNPKDTAGNPKNPVVPSVFPENFAGTMVPWNNYTFQKTEIKINLKNTGIGAELAKGQIFKARLYCVPPPLVGGEEEGLPSSAAAIKKNEVTFKESSDTPGTWESAITSDKIPVAYRCVLKELEFPEFDAKVTTTITKDATQPTQTADKDGVTQLFEYGKPNAQGEKASQAKDDKNLNLQPGDKQMLAFIVHPDLVNDARATQKQSIFTIENKFERPAAKLMVQQKVRKNNAGSYMSVGQALVDKKEVSYTVKYKCTDKYLKDSQGKVKIYQGSLDLGAPTDSDGALSTKKYSLLSDTKGGNFVPATSSCVVWHENKPGKDPIDKYKPNLYLNPSALVKTEGANDQEEKLGTVPTPDQLKVAINYLDPQGTKETTITFEDFYLVPLENYRIGTAVEGTRSEEALADKTGKFPQVTYRYSCKYPDYLPTPNNGYKEVKGILNETITKPVSEKTESESQADPNKPTPGSTADGTSPETHTATPGEPNTQIESEEFVELPQVPVDTKCTVTGTKTTSNQPYLKVAANWLPWFGNQFPTKEKLEKATDKSLIKDKQFTITLGPVPKDPNQTGETESQTVKQGVVLYTVYSNGTKVRIYKATAPKPDGQVVPGATFSLHERKVDGSAGAEIKLNPVEGQSGVYESQTELPPGTYLMGNTNAGTNAGERFPFAWKFDIALDPADQKAEQDTKVTLSKETGSSGLVAAYAPTDQVKAWQIELADVNFGSLPFTGGYLPWLWLVGISLVAASAAVMWHRRHE
ncbi:DUF5979 domain-containing protein [Varibaculum vaginae]|uniref:DUF5979 domain-containing protein n=1 Tax=Varibaculum vaginae TaxID=2364797 RepID=UPI000F073E21|nr:DUF5979 domain-containing protein [Varibaculum vaginae]